MAKKSSSKRKRLLKPPLSVADPCGSAAFYKRLFGFDTLLDSDRLVAREA